MSVYMNFTEEELVEVNEFLNKFNSESSPSPYSKEWYEDRND